jgi:SAM-dependent methyltransferase
MTISAYPKSHAEVYDAHPFYGRPCADSHPGRIAEVARGAGIEPAAVESCRVLELGCGDGSNLIAIAESLPGATCVGIDLSQRHIELGQAAASALRLKNLSLRHGDLLSLTPDALLPGQFDYIIADCFYSWVPRQAQDQMFALAARDLAPHGVMFVSYNLLPGWRMMQVLRDFFSFHNRRATSSAQRIQQSLEAAELLPLLCDNASSDVARFIGAYTRQVQQHLARLDRWRDQTLIHDIIGDVNTPVYFSTFVNHAARFGLRYLEDAELRRGLPENLPEQTVQKLARHVDNALDLEQYIDFAEMRMSRQSLLWRAELQPKPSR